jgi:hypothetical protein
MAEGLTDAQIVERLQRLDAQVRTISEHLGIPYDDPGAGVSQAVRDLVAAGDRMAAAKRHADETGVDFVEAQRVVNAL